ncbi:MAG TPA: hypothetical protein VG502_19660 [Flexivirga sp.]|uniref:hypothetical protein n=1 Tax=Flexivirga sp. TaxID=1962927 RepID=UPI002C1309C3|nr:hypothetical protein [Flexivirga sp.]HWC24517.1 hypothetical protein [Flexivirga sp.]
MKTLLRRAVIGATVAGAVGLPATPAFAQTVGDDCGVTVSTSCSSTTHFSDMEQWLGQGTPGDSSSCPAYFDNDWAFESGTGNGVFHININKDGDTWVSNTWTGAATITLYPPSSVQIVADSDDNVISSQIIGPPDQVLTGHNTQWFGASFNNKDSVTDFTFSFRGTDQSGNPITVHNEQHQQWLPGSDPDGPPSASHVRFTCG